MKLVSIVSKVSKVSVVKLRVDFKSVQFVKSGTVWETVPRNLEQDAKYL